MKQKPLIFICILLFITNSLTAQRVKEIIYKKVIDHGEKTYRYVQFFSLVKYDSKGNAVYEEDSFRKRWNEYNDKNLIIHSREDYYEEFFYRGDDTPIPADSESWYEYDDQDRLICWKDSRGDSDINEYTVNSHKFIHRSGDYYFMFEQEFNNDEQLIRNLEMSNMDGEEYKYEQTFIYKEDERIEHDNNGKITTSELNSQGKTKHLYTNDGYEKWFTYNENGKLIYTKDNNNQETFYDYDPEGHQIYFKDEKQLEIWREFDENGREIKYKRSDGFEYTKEYDSEGREIHYKTNANFERWYEYDFYPNGKLRTKKEYHAVKEK